MDGYKTIEKKLSIFFLGIFFLSGCSHFQNSKLKSVHQYWNPEFEIHRDVLKNGLTILSVIDPTSPLVSFSSWFKVGSAQEKPTQTGIAHLFEHLMFKGTKTYPSNSFVEKLEEKGGMVNAQTNKDGTYYYEVFLPKYLPMVIELEADRLKNLEITKEKLQVERKVVHEERRMRLESDFQAMQFEEMNRVAFQKHPYGWPVIGYEKILEALSVEDCRDFFKTYYQPANLLIVISGNFDYKETLNRIEKNYGDIQGLPVPQLAAPSVIKHIPKKPIVLEKPVKGETLLIGYYTPSIYDADNQKLEFLSDLLFGLQSSKANALLVRKKKIALDIDVGSMATRLQSLFLIRVEVKPGKSFEESLKELDKVLEKVKFQKNYISEEEIQRVKNQELYQNVSQSKSPFGVASLHASGELIWNDYNKIYSLLDSFFSIKENDLVEVARKYLVANNRIVMVLKPERKRK